MKDFDSKWESDDNEEEKLKTFMNQILILSEEYLDATWTKSQNLGKFERRFCLLIGCEYYQELVDDLDTEYFGDYSNPIYHKSFQATHTYQKLRQAQDTQNIKYLAKILQVIFLILEEEAKNDVACDWDEERSTNDIIDNFHKELEGLLKCQKYFSIVKRGQSVTFYPAGSRLLDEQTINKALEGLEDYPNSAKSFEKALNDYENGNNNRNLLDDLRLSLEQLLKKVLNNKKSFENQKQDLGNFLKNQGVHKEFINFLNGTLFNYYEKFQNEKIKHQNKTEIFLKEEVEYNIYLTGILIRFLTQLVKRTDAILEEESKK